MKLEAIAIGGVLLATSAVAETMPMQTVCNLTDPKNDCRISEKNESITITGDFDRDGAEQECFELVGAYRGMEKIGSYLEHPNWHIFIKRKGGGILTECPLP